MSDRKPWSYTAGSGKSRVVVEENTARGGKLQLRWWDRTKNPPSWSRLTLDRVAERNGRGQNLTDDCEAFAIAAAQHKSLELAGVLESKNGTSERKLATIGQAEGLITDKETGKYPHRSPFRDELVRALRLASAVWGPDTPWTDVEESYWTKLLRRRLEALVADNKKAVRATEITISRLITVVRWLQDMKHVPRDAALPPRQWKKDITRHWQGTTGSDRPPITDRPRYTLDEFLRILDKADFDPRLSLLLRLSVGLRPGQVARAHRADLTLPVVDWDAPIAKDEQGRDLSQYGTIFVHGAGKKGGGLVDLTRGQRRIVDHALSADGYLGHIEARYRLGELKDYVLFPSGYVVGRVAMLRDKESKLALAASVDFARSITGGWIRKNWRVAEKRAGVEHQKGRATYGGRRLSVDYNVKQGLSPSGIQAGGLWADSKMPLEVYREGENESGRREARDARAQMMGETE